MAEKEYIEREAALKQNYFSESKTPDENYRFNAEIKFCISSLPAADVAPVRHGRFRRLTFSGDTIICSECKMAYNIFETNGAENFNFCPHCGARMDGDPDANGNDNKTPET